ncbi:GAF and ANTAR domain-containing protein [Allobranchiibius sp. GilTou38]|uniref:GAF and ANTAR domain-containing protein n=1 Tax=Allobranchiibius sp. GilTou38 TaxID=2815210 RepID=UPI001AA14B9C|nr:GAF and ANTAR domain-containing protein [Allobranchiibius sp. GilTou38]MBO1767238.1 GAF and ANTAR domain-containing protein [Allobranchiibius sp. GilTou38]
MDTIQQILRDLASTDRGVATLPQALCAACAASVPVTGVGMSLMSAHGPEEVVAATDEVATTLMELQFTLGEGPCVDASALGKPVLQPQLRRAGPDRWTGFVPAALAAGIEAVFAFPLHIGVIRLGVLSLYRDAPGVLTPECVSQALVFSDVATQILLDLQAQMPAGDVLHPDLVVAGLGRAQVHQATGMIAVQAEVSMAAALMLLRARAYRTDRSITAVACDVLASTIRFHPVDQDDD